MVDNVSASQRSFIMSRVKSKDTQLEILLRKLLSLRGLRYRLHYPILGKPDIVFVSKKVAVFIDGCFWHLCPKCRDIPVSNRRFWLRKLTKNALRDRRITQQLSNEGWKVIRVWGHQLVAKPENVVSRIAQLLR